jgi:hypothetical protein
MACALALVIVPDPLRVAAAATIRVPFAVRTPDPLITESRVPSARATAVSVLVAVRLAVRIAIALSVAELTVPEPSRAPARDPIPRVVPVTVPKLVINA